LTLQTHETRRAAPPGLKQPEGQPVDRPAPRTRTRTILLIVVGLVCLFAVVLVNGTIQRTRTTRGLAATTREANVPPVVNVIRPQPATRASLSLPGTTQAISDAIIYARTSGYLSKRHVDIGDNVNAGQLLAEIESPEIDQQLSQARADLDQSIKNLELQQANLDLARVTMNRYTEADKEGAVAKELVDQQVAAYRTAQASVAAAQAAVASNRANVQRNEQLTSFERVLAPFAGTITQRNVDIGALITAGSPTDNTAVAPSSVTGTPNGLFQVSQIDTLRVFVNVPQVYAPNVKPGLPARVRLRGQFTKPVAAAVARTANALDPGTRTLLTEVDVPNASHTLLPGMFVYVDFEIAPAGTRFRVPATAVVVSARGTEVVVVANGGELHFQPVVLGRDFGSSIDIQDGLSGGEQIVRQPTVSFQEGQTVTPREAQNAAR
jgi:RND family efflux transporter MFP subunit